MKIVISLLLISSILSAQPTIEWQKTFGGSDTDEPRSIHHTSDGGYIVAGRTFSTDGDAFGNHGGHDVLILKLDNNGVVQWKRIIGGTGNDIAQHIFPTSDGGYFVCGYSESNNFDISGNHGGAFDGWVAKLSNFGAIEWQKSLGGSDWDDIWSAQQTMDNGFILVGRSNSNDGDVTGNHGKFDFWVVKLNEMGIIEWEQSYGGSKDDIPASVIQTDDGGYLVTGETASSDGDVTVSHGNIDYWLIKLSSNGVLEWQNTYGGNNWDTATDLIQATDGGYVVIGLAGSDSGDVTGHHGNFDFWVIKVSKIGKMEWQKALGGTGPDRARSIVATSDGGYVVFGGTESNNGDVVGNNGGAEFWVVKLSQTGDLVWQQTYGGTMAESGFAIDNSSDNGFILTGYAWSTNGDLTGSINHGSNDFWVVKLTPESASSAVEPERNPLHIDIFPNPASQSISLRVPTEASVLNVRVSDMLGREVLQQEISNGGQLDVSTLPNGMYLILVVSKDGKVFQGKFQRE